MKVIVAVALFAFVAVQLCQAAPKPDDDKKEVPPVHSGSEIVVTGVPVGTEKEAASSNSPHEEKATTAPGAPEASSSAAPAAPHAAGDDKKN